MTLEEEIRDLAEHMKLKGFMLEEIPNYFEQGPALVLVYHAHGKRYGSALKLPVDEAFREKWLMHNLAHAIGFRPRWEKTG